MEHRAEYPTMNAAVQAVAKQVGVGKDRYAIAWLRLGGLRERAGVTTGESEESKRLKTENLRLREDVVRSRRA
jgi:transposase